MRVALITVSVLLLLAGPANAALFHLTGEIFYQTDVQFTNFTLLSDATNVRIWTDSFEYGVHFDPITALWDNGGALLGQNDDNPYVGPGQDYWDSGMVLPSLAAGNYQFSVAVYSNFANGPSISDGFAYDGQTPVPIGQHWSGGDGRWSLWLDGVDQASGPDVPEPTTAAMLVVMAIPAALLAWRRRK
jgi:hypothetical protein